MPRKRKNPLNWFLRAKKETVDTVYLCDGAPFDLRAASGNDNGPKRFDAVAYSGGVINAKGMGGPVVVDLAGVTILDGATGQMPILQDHNEERVVGHTENIQIHATSGITAQGLVSGGGEAATEVLTASRNGFKWRMSIGARVSKREQIPAGASVRVNGRTFKGPLGVLRAAQIYELSVLALAGDFETSVNIAASLSEKDPNMEFQEWLKAKGFDPDNLVDQQEKSLKASYDAELKLKADEDARKAADDAKAKETIKASLDKAGETKDPDPTADLRAAHAAEITRLGKLSEACKDHPVLHAKAVTEEWDVTKAELEVLKANLDKAPNFHVHKGERTPDGNVLEAAMCQSLHIKDHEKGFGDKTLQAAHTLYRDRVSLQEILMQAACDNGYHGRPGERISAGNLKSVISHAMPTDLRAAAASTLSLPEIFSNVANKELLQGFMEEDQAWREIAVVRSVPDFKTMTSYRMLDDFTYEELPPDGVIKHGQVGEETFTRKADTYAKMFALTRTDIINDDMGAFDDLRARLGRGAARTFNNLFWAKFINNSSFFTAGRGNYITGATTTLLIDFVGLQLAIDAFDTMRSTAVPPNARGKRIGGTPDILLVPPELDAVAARIFATVAPTKATDVNIYSGKYRPVKVTQLSDSTFTGYSATAWYLLRPKEILASMVVSFLNGVAQPTVESAEASFNRLGVEFRGYHDFGCDQAEWLCGVKSKGSA